MARSRGASERELTDRLAQFFPRHRDALLGIGDDAAVVRQRHDRAVLCCDPVIEGVHFDAAAPLRLVGKKAVNRNLSDLAAMGAVPDWLLVSLVLPLGTSQTRLLELLGGIRAAAKRAACYVIGGDVASSSGPLVVTVSAFGHLPGRALTRSGARVGDSLHVTGPLGGSIAGHHLRFQPALAEGVWLAKQLDISDGLLLDLQTMLAASSRSGTMLGAELDANAIPIRKAARDLADGQALQHALTDGEDYVLLWSQRPRKPLPERGPLSTRALRSIGRIISEPSLWVLRAGGRERVLDQGYQHNWQTTQKAPR
jgi:thiamine-monophosphate kinase